MGDATGDAAQRIAAAADATALDAFNSGEPGSQVVTPELRALVADTAACGVLACDWPAVRPVLAAMLAAALATTAETEQQRHPTTGPHRQADPAPLVALLEAFEDEPPFTVQRLCELLLDPTRHYSRLAALEHALCKLLYVTSTAPCGPEAAAAAAARAASRARGSGGTPPFGAAVGGDSPGSPGGGLIELPRREEPPPSEFALDGL